jgi:ribulose-phosphate 3-epimerase
MHVIVPAIIPKNFDHLFDSIQRIPSSISEIQIDIVDGKFVPYTSWPYLNPEGKITDLNPITDRFRVEIDFMIRDPETVLPLYIEQGIASCVLHLETTNNLFDCVNLCMQNGVSVGFSIGNDTSQILLEHAVSAFHPHYIQLMGISRIGVQGMPFDIRVLTTIRSMRERFPHIKISIDGSVNHITLPQLQEAGAHRFVVGSALFNAPDFLVAYDQLTELAS